MKIILSRKGFDGESGGYPSPILPNGRLLSLPIPYKYCDNSYADICRNVGLPEKLVEQLSNGRFKATWRAHLDPDLRRESLRHRPKCWRPVYGAGSPTGYPVLDKQGVDKGDLFLFFGWFRRTTLEGGKVRYDRSAPDIHALFGWLQVDEVVDATGSCPTHLRWVRYSDHFRLWQEGKLYVARERLDLPGLRNRKLPGGGAFDAFRQELCLTAPGRSRSAWALPKWFWPSRGKTPLGYHKSKKRWTRTSRGLILQTVAKGQEFVLDTRNYPEAKSWARKLIEGNSSEVVTQLW